ncbi:MAG: hypothetical protein WCQ65_11855 [Fermentimonas sp.]
MPAHVWTSALDFQYCTLTNCEIVSGSVQLSGSTGNIISDIKDSTFRVRSYDEIEITDSIPSGSGISYYWRSGTLPLYDEDYWSDWQLIDATKIYTEFTISLLDDRFGTEFPIDNLVYAGLEEYWRSGKRYIDSCRTGSAIVGEARVGADGVIANISDDCTIDGNLVQVDTDTTSVFTDDRVNVVIKYIPQFPLLGSGNRYFQYKAEMSGSVSPSISEVIVNYRMDTQYIMERAFPLMYRRV